MTVTLSSLFANSVGPANSDIATAVAGQVPTISAINTSVANNAPSPNAWTYIAAITPTNGGFLSTFSSISGYKTLRLIGYFQMSGPVVTNIRINGDSSSKYSYHYLQYGNGSTAFTLGQASNASSQLNLITTGTGVNVNIDLTFEFANNTSLFKRIKGYVDTQNASGTAIGSMYYGGYASTSAITSISFGDTSSGTSFNGVGTVYLLGAN
jgi:hypothetical protein